MSKGGRRTARDTATNEKPLDQIKYLPWPGRQTSHLTVSFVVVLCKKKRGEQKKGKEKKLYKDHHSSWKKLAKTKHETVKREAAGKSHRHRQFKHMHASASVDVLCRLLS